MTKKFPTLDIVKQSLTQMLSFPKGLAITSGMFAVLLLLMLVMFSIIFSGVDMAKLEAAMNGDISSLPTSNNASAGTVLLLLFGFVGLFFVYTWIFNMWIRFGAFGPKGAFFDKIGQGIIAAIITAIKLVFITIFLGIIGLVVMLILVALGIASVDAAGTLNTSATNILISNLISVGVISSVYALFSSNLTQTALGTDAEEIGPPHVFEFAMVLFSINALVIIPVAVLQLVLPLWFILIIQLVGYLWLTAAIPLAHGIRYDWQRQVFAGETAADQFNLDSGDQQNTDDEENL